MKKMNFLLSVILPFAFLSSVQADEKQFFCQAEVRTQCWGKCDLIQTHEYSFVLDLSKKTADFTFGDGTELIHLEMRYEERKDAAKKRDLVYWSFAGVTKEGDKLGGMMNEISGRFYADYEYEGQIDKIEGWCRKTDL